MLYVKCALSLSDSNPFSFISTILSYHAVDKARDAEMVATGSMDEFQKIMAELATNPAIKDDEKDTDEVKELKKKRRSTLIQTKSWKESLRMDIGKLNLEDDE